MAYIAGDAKSDPIVIVAGARTPMGGFQGALSSLTAAQLGAVAIRASIERAGILPESVSEALMGCVLPAGQGQAPARQAALGGGLPLHVPCTTINKMCGSGMKAAMMAYEALHARPDDIIIAGGMESMSNAPYLLPKARGGYRMGHGQVLDHMFLDGLEDAYERGRLMGTFAEDTAGVYGFTRQAQDEFAIASLQRAMDAQTKGLFVSQISPVLVAGRKGDVLVSDDEQPAKADLTKIPTLKPAFRKDGTVTAANSSSISDGAAALVLMRASKAEKMGLDPVARIVAIASHAQAPALFTTAPVGAMRKLLDAAGWNADDVDLYEINEAFAVVTMCAMKDMGLPHEKVNVHGGACALGHPIGASGARIVVTLIAALQAGMLKRGVASLCIGGGEATAMALELL